MEEKIMVILSPVRPPRVASVVGEEIFYDKLAEGETLVMHDGFSGKYKPRWTGKEWVETATQEELLPMLNIKKSEKLTQLSISATKAMQSFTYDNLTFEMSGQVETRLDRLERKLLADDTIVEMWLVLDGTYKLGERDFIYINKENIISFANAYESKVRSVLSWKKGAEYWLNLATTFEEVEAISTDYPQ